MSRETTGNFTTHVILKNEDELEVDVCFRFYDGCKATRWHPGDPPEVEITEVTRSDNDEEVPGDQISGGSWSGLEEMAMEIGHEQLKG